MESKSGIPNLSVEELKKYKALLDEGTITEEEFQNIKAEFLKHDGKADSQPATTPAAKSGVDAYLKFIIPAVVVIMAIIVVMISKTQGNNPETIAKKCALSEYGHYREAMSLYSYDFEDYVTGRFGSEESLFAWQSRNYNCIVSSWNDYYKARDEHNKDHYGKYTVSAEVSKSKNVSIKDLYNDNLSYIWELEDYTAFDFDQIEEAKVVDVKITVEGENDSYQGEKGYYMVKYNGKWGVFRVTMYLDYE